MNDNNPSGGFCTLPRTTERHYRHTSF